jgi:hypothetical protein
MKRARVTGTSGVLVLALATTVGGCIGADEPRDDEGETESAVRGGTTAGGAGVVEIAVLSADGTSVSWCSGVVIAPRALITAAHCFNDALGSTKSGLVNVVVNYTRDGVNWDCISNIEAPGRCVVSWTNTWVRRLKGSDDPFVGNDFAVLLSTPNVEGPRWHGMTDYRSIDITVPSSGKRYEVWGDGFAANDETGDGIMRHASFKFLGLDRSLKILSTKSTSSVGLCHGDSGGPYFTGTDDWVTAVHGLHEDSNHACAGTDKYNAAYRLTQNSLDVIGFELANVDPSGPGCGPVGLPNKYRCFLP